MREKQGDRATRRGVRAVSVGESEQFVSGWFSWVEVKLGHSLQLSRAASNRSRLNNPPSSSTLSVYCGEGGEQ